MSDDNKTPSGTPKGTDPMAKARAAKAEKAAAKTPEPEMEIVERKVTETTHKTTPTGQEKTKTVETVFRPKAASSEAGTAAPAVAPAADTAANTAEPTATPEFTEAERAGIERAGQKTPRSKRPLFIALFILALIIAAAVYVFTADPEVGESNDPAPAEVETIIEGESQRDETDDGEVEFEEQDNGNAVEETVVVPITPPSPKPEPRRAERAETLEPGLESASPPPPSPERNMTAYVMRPFGDRRDDFIVYDFDFGRVCVTNSSERAELPQSGCMAYESLSAEWKGTYDQLCRRYYAFPEVCPADITVDVVIRELQYHEND